jgi:signal transduction histidine kinase
MKENFIKHMRGLEVASFFPFSDTFLSFPFDKEENYVILPSAHLSGCPRGSLPCFAKTQEFTRMASRPENAFPQVAEPELPSAERRAAVLSEEVFPGVESNPQLVQEYTQLRERFLRTTNALASAAHDLKTPLSILNGYVELLQSEKLGGLNARQREIIRDMRSSGQRLQHFIQDFLTYSVLETGHLKMHYEAGDMNSCLADVCRLWSPRFQEKGVALYFLAHDKLTEFSFDSAKVERVISNLLENASKFTPAGGTVWLHAEPYMWERRGASQAGVAGERRRRNLSVPNSVKASVADTGPGIPPEYHIEVFDDFFRMPHTEKQTDGMGLGLAISRRLVNAMGGKIWVESEPGAGAKFCFLIPLKPIPSKGKNK